MLRRGGRAAHDDYNFTHLASIIDDKSFDSDWGNNNKFRMIGQWDGVQSMGE